MRYISPVALLAEGVDRNQKPIDKTEKVWVALLAEGVDRNIPNRLLWEHWKGRPPRGGRG